MIIDDINTIIPNAVDALTTLYIREATTLISLYLNIPVVTIPDRTKFIPLEPIETIVFPDTPTSVTVDNGVSTVSEGNNIADTYPDAIIKFVILAYNKRGNEGLKSFGQGSRSGTYEDGLSDSIKVLLPSPFVTMLNVRRDVYGDV